MNLVIRISAALLLLFAVYVKGADAPACVFQPDVVYNTVDGADLKLDIAMPCNAKGPCPLVLCMHGGGWAVGDKSKLDDFARMLAARGYVAATINYRFAPKYRFPAQLDDARSALRFLKMHAGGYQIDSTRVAALGESAGAQLALLMGLMDDPQQVAGEPSTRVQCVVNYFGPTDFTRWVVTPLHEMLAQRMVHKSIPEILMALFGTGDLKSPLMAAASPLTFVSPSAPPIITFHGTLDPIVAYKQAELLHEALRKAGAVEKLVPIAGAHGRWLPDTRAAADAQAVEWLDSWLKGSANPASVTARTKTAMGGPKVDNGDSNH